MSSFLPPEPNDLITAHHWKRVQTRLRAELGEDVFTSWFSSAKIESCSQGHVVISVATRFLKHWIEHNFGTRLLELWALETSNAAGATPGSKTGSKSGSKSGAKKAATGAAQAEPAVAGASGDQSNGQTIVPVERITILVRSVGVRKKPSFGPTTALDEKAAAHAPANTNRAAPRTDGVTAKGSGLGAALGAGDGSGGRDGGQRGSQKVTASLKSRSGGGVTVTGEAGSASGTPLDPKCTFDAFAVGESNQFAYRAALQIAQERSVLGCKVLFVRGGVGLGKTHLCQAIAHQLIGAGHRTLYLTAEKFMRDFVISLRTKAAVDYKEALSAIDVLVVDDIQFLSGQTIQGEFCHVINTLIDAGKTLVVAADRAPASLDSIDARMQSRLSSGLVVEIAAMDRSVRRALLERRRAAYKSEGGQADVSDAVLDKVADLISTNGRDLDGAFNRIIAEIGLNNVPVTEHSVAGVIGFLLSNTEAPRVKIEDIQRATALQFGLTKTDLLSQRRTKQIVGPRQIAMYLAKVMTVRSLPDIGRRFGGRDHTTVLHAVRKIERELETDPSLQKTIEALKSAILSQS
ncbi:MAG: chromosomal replication initiator protein DnaA [Devosiaceae bacterium]|nr:chromosomal replication initiator protein DnaA [Devosiaceae bacterium MH13]